MEVCGNATLHNLWNALISLWNSQTIKQESLILVNKSVATSSASFSGLSTSFSSTSTSDNASAYSGVALLTANDLNLVVYEVNYCDLKISLEFNTISQCIQVREIYVVFHFMTPYLTS